MDQFLNNPAFTAAYSTMCPGKKEILELKLLYAKIVELLMLIEADDPHKDVNKAALEKLYDERYKGIEDIADLLSAQNLNKNKDFYLFRNFEYTEIVDYILSEAYNTEAYNTYKMIIDPLTERRKTRDQELSLKRKSINDTRRANFKKRLSIAKKELNEPCNPMWDRVITRIFDQENADLYKTQSVYSTRLMNMTRVSQILEEEETEVKTETEAEKLAKSLKLVDITWRKITDEIDTEESAYKSSTEFQEMEFLIDKEGYSIGCDEIRASLATKSYFITTHQIRSITTIIQKKLHQSIENIIGTVEPEKQSAAVSTSLTGVNDGDTIGKDGAEELVRAEDGTTEITPTPTQ